MAKKQTVKQQLDIVRNREKQADLQRANAGNILNLGNVLGLSPTQAEKVLERINLNSGAFTEQLQVQDLQRLERAMNELQNEFKVSGVRGGIHPRTVINKSRKIDLQRCRAEINTAVPATSNKNGVVEFRVNASARSKDTHHMVSVEFLNFQAAISGGNITNKMANAVNTGAIRFDCDCGRHRFWYRYIATVGGFAHGKPETGIPKIRNPKLTGIACKHVLRVMLVLTKSPSFTNYMKQYIARVRGTPLAGKKTLGRKQIEALAEKISSESWNKQTVRQLKNAKMPENITDAFNTNGKKAKSIAGVGVTPKELAKAKAEALQTQEQLREINRRLNDPNIQQSVSPEVLAQIQRLLDGGQ